MDNRKSIGAIERDFRRAMGRLKSETRAFQLPETDSSRILSMDNLVKTFQEPISLKPGYQLALIMYDIEDHKVRRYVAKYLERMGYVRIQKSIFFGNIQRKLHQRVHKVLKEVNQSYENGDSLLFLPVGTDQITNLKMVGKNINFEIVVSPPESVFI